MSRRFPMNLSRWKTQGIIGSVSRSRDGYGIPHSHVWFDAADGVRLAGSLIGEAGGDTAIVFVHGFNGYRTKPKIRTLVEGLARRFPVVAFDLRGHGQSEGACTGGELESLDVHAAVEFARRRGFRRIVTVGASLGGIAVIRAAGSDGDADAVVSISTPAKWGFDETPALRRMTWIFTSRVGRQAIRRLFGTRIHLNWGNPDPPLESITRIHQPILIVHGADDHFFSVDQAEALFTQAPEPKRLLIMEHFGHAEDGFTDAFAAQLVEEIEALLALAPRDDSATV